MLSSNKRLLIITGILLGMAASNALALLTDQQEPVHIHADRVIYADKTHQAILTGHVHMQQGSSDVKADQLIINRTSTQQVDKVVAIGTPAHFVLLPQGQKQVITATALKLIYFPLTHEIELQGEAHVAQGQNEFSGDNIQFNTQTQAVNSIALPGHQVSLTIQPQSQLLKKLP